MHRARKLDMLVCRHSWGGVAVVGREVSRLDDGKASRWERVRRREEGGEHAAEHQATGCTTADGGVNWAVSSGRRRSGGGEGPGWGGLRGVRRRRRSSEFDGQSQTTMRPRVGVQRLVRNWR